MKTSLQSYILYKEQRPIPNEPHGIPWPLLNIWNIYAALNFFFFLNIFPLIFGLSNEFCLPEQFRSLLWIPFKYIWGFCGCSIMFLDAVFYRLKEDAWNRSIQFRDDLCSCLRSVNVMFPGAVYMCWELKLWLQCDDENFQSQQSFKSPTITIMLV